MPQTSTLEKLARFTQIEKEQLKFLGLYGDSGQPELPEILVSPSESVVNNILNYSKALSVRKTREFGDIEMVLN